ncbi:MAG: adenylate kinase [Fimbriimonadaceae bacterium]|nr:adenylate kinase [Fimbriimonadaceae bacterium]
MRLLIFGPPGAGKGTVAKEVTAAEGLPHISTGDMLRAAVAAGSELGAKVKGVMEAGGLVSDELIIDVVEDRLQQGDTAGGWLLDGFPRTLPQAEALDALLQKLAQRVDLVIVIEVADATIVDRLAGRRVCLACGATYHATFSPTKAEGVCDACGEAKVVQREDDKPDTVLSRLATYHEKTKPLIEYYERQGLTQSFDNSGAPAATVAAVRAALAAR